MDELMRLGLNNAAWATALALAVAVGARIFWRRPAVVHILWLLVLIKLVSPSLVRIDFPSIMAQHHVPPTRIKSVESREEESRSSFRAVAVAFSTAPAPSPDASSPPRDEPAAKKSLARPIRTTPRAWPWRPVALAFWLAGAGVWWAIVGLSGFRFRSLKRSARPAPADLEKRIQDLAALLKLRAIPTIGIVPARIPPMLWAPLIGAPHLLVPNELWARFDTAQQDTVLVHELAHLKRRDHWVRRLEAVVMGLYWWDPIAWWARRELERTEEECCDAWVVQALPASVAAYAEALVGTAVFLSGLRQPLPVGASKAGRTLPLKRRLNMILCDASAGPIVRTVPRTMLVLGVFALPILPALASGEQAAAQSQVAPAPAQTQEPAQSATPPAEVDGKTGGAFKEIALDPAKPARKVRICQPIVREVSDYIDAGGQLEAAHTVQLRARVSGIVVNVDCRPGQLVKTDDLLFEIDARSYEAERNKAEAEVRRAESRVKRWASQLARAKMQSGKGAISEQELEQTEGEFGEAEASLRAAMADRDLARLKLDSTRVRAPIAGTISGSVLDAGSLVTADRTALATIVALDPMHIVFILDEAAALSLKSKNTKHAGPWSGPLVMVGLSGEEGLARTAQVNLADLEVKGTEGVQCRASIPNHDGILFPGLSARVRVVTGSPHKAVLVPKRAITHERQSPHVHVVNEKNTVELRPVKVGLPFDGLIAVTEGLRADEWLIADAAEPME